ncbi:hypothetical protein M3Y99_01536800 [Aphelenchoides fujianensis]|nr:hypothetical protein M3Y99_01536800 [Aphelenchoides fujianensis]
MLERRAQRAAARAAPYPQANSQPQAAGPDPSNAPVAPQPPRAPNARVRFAPLPPPPNGGPQNAPPPNGPPPIEIRPLPGPSNGPQQQQNQPPMMRYNPMPLPPFFVQYNGNMNGPPQNMGPVPGMPMAAMPPPPLQRGGPNGLDGVIGWMMQDAPPPLQPNPPPANNGEDDVIVLDDDSTEERSDLSVLSSAVSLVVPPAFAFANMNDRIVSPAKFVTKLQQFFTLSFAFERLETFRERTLGFVVANLRDVRRLSGWKQFSNEHPEISTEILDRIKL